MVIKNTKIGNEVTIIEQCSSAIISHIFNSVYVTLRINDAIEEKVLVELAGARVEDPAVITAAFLFVLT